MSVASSTRRRRHHKTKAEIVNLWARHWRRHRRKEILCTRILTFCHLRATPDSTYRQQLEQERRQPGKLKLKRCIDGEITYEEVEFTAADLVQVADLGHGTCGQVLKMKLKDHQDEIILNRTMAVKVRSSRLFIRR